MNEITTTETREVSTEVVGVGADVETWEIKLGYASLMHGKSKMVEDNPRSVFVGEIRDSISGELLGDENVPFEAILFGRQSSWLLSKKTGTNKWEYAGQEPMTAANAGLPWNFTQDGEEMKRTKVIRFFCLNAKNVFSAPIIVSLSSASGFPCGQKLLSTLRSFATRKPPISSVDRVILFRSTKAVSKTGFSYVAWTFDVGPETNPEQRAVATTAAKNFAEQRASFEAKANVAGGSSEADTDEIPF